MRAKASDTRRAFAARVTAALGALAAAAAVVPGLGLLLAPLRKAGAQGAAPVPVASDEDVRPDRPLRVTAVGERHDAWARLDRVTLGSCWLVRAHDGAPVRAFSTVCPHLGCGVDYDAQARTFDCPCHGSSFDLDGRCLKGPALRGLDELEVTTESGEVRVRYQRFRAGSAAKEPIG